MSNKIIMVILSILMIFFLTAQTCSFGTTSSGLAADCIGEGDIVCDDTEAYECGLAAYGIGYYVSRSSENDAEYCGAVDTTDTDDDGDGYTNRIEIRAGSDPSDASDVPATQCTDDSECAEGYNCVGSVCTSGTTTGTEGYLEAVCSSDATTVEEMESIHFTGSSSTDDGTIVSYVWDFDYLGMGVTVADTDFGYADAGIYSVTLTVTDDDGNTDNCAIEITVEEPAATLAADCGGTYAGAVGETITFDASATTGDVQYYNWEFGDGSLSTGQTSPTVTHEYDGTGTYTVTLVVQENFGDKDTCTTTAIIS